MQDLGPKISQFSSFIKREFSYRMCIFNITGVVIMESVNICPDNNLFRIQGNTDEGCGKITTPAFEIIDLAEDIPADEPLGNE
jgi:hypothetical protein